MLVVTTESVPGYQVSYVIGEVVGATARMYNVYADGVKDLAGRVSPSRRMRRALIRCRQEAVNEMVAEAAQRGANAVIGMRFDHREINERWAEICAYGTAVRLHADHVTPADPQPSGTPRG
jgi:uncharacterized protein YbjQ (UPF0145 family)